MMVSYGNFIFFLGKCSIPFFNGNLNLIFPSFISIIAPIILRKGLPRIIGQETLQSISSTIKSMGTYILFATIRTSLILPIGFCRCTRVGVPYYHRTRARAVAAPRGKACRVTARTLRGSLEDHSRTKYSNQGPGKRSLPGRPTKAPARGACREGQPRPRQEDLAGKRQDPGKRS